MASIAPLSHFLCVKSDRPKHPSFIRVHPRPSAVKIFINHKKVDRPKHHPNQLLAQYRSIRTASKSRTNKLFLLEQRDVTLIYS